MSYSKLFHDELGPLRPDLVDLSDYEDSDMDDDDDDDLLLNLQDDFILNELNNQLNANVLSADEERQIFENTNSIAEGLM
jgi:hypothetical protein